MRAAAFPEFVASDLTADEPRAPARIAPRPMREPQRPQDRPVPCDFALVAERSAFEALRAEWDELFARSGRPQQAFQTFDWLWRWANHYLDAGVELSIVVGRRQGRLALVWPLVRRRFLGLRMLSFMGEPVSQYGDALVEDGPDEEALLGQAFDFIANLPVDVVRLRRVRDDAAVGPILACRASPTGPPLQAPFVDFAGAPDGVAFEKRFSSKLRSERRRHLRRLEALGPVAFAQHAPGTQARDLARLAIALKRAWAVKDGRVAPALFDPRLEAFFVDAASGEGRGPDLRISTLASAGETIGVEISLACKGRLFGHVLAAKPGFEKQGAGAILAGHSIVSALEQGFDGYDLLAPADRYKREWASRSVGVRDFAMARTWAGRAFVRVWLDFGHDACRTLVKRLPPRLGRLWMGGAS